MMKKSAILLLLLFAALAAGAQPFYRKPVAPVRNVIVMIPDGTSTSVLAAARWYKFYNDPSQRTLNLDSCLCGLVGSFSSDSPIPCSAPAMSAYMTGMPQQAGNVSVYPAANPAQDIVEVESGRALSLIHIWSQRRRKDDPDPHHQPHYGARQRSCDVRRPRNFA